MRDRFKQLLEINEVAFRDGCFNAAHHALIEAIHVAAHLGDGSLVSEACAHAQDQLAWLAARDSDGIILYRLAVRICESLRRCIPLFFNAGIKTAAPVQKGT